MEQFEEDVASGLLRDLSLYEPYRDGSYSLRREVVAQPGLDFSEQRSKRLNGSVVAPQQVPGLDTPPAGSKVQRGTTSRAPVPLELCPPHREPLLSEDANCTRSEVALPCYGGASERHRRFSLEGHRYSAGSAFDKPGYGRYSAPSPRSSVASGSSSQEHSKQPSPRSSVSSPRSSLVWDGGGGGGGVALSPRSSYASTASDTSKHSSPRASLSGYECASKPSSNRTSGISMGYDQRHMSPRSSTASPRSSVCSQDGSARVGAVPACVLSPRSSISSHSSRSSRSSRGSMSAYPDLQLPSPRSSMLGAGLPEDAAAQDFGDSACVYGRAQVQPVPAAQEPQPYPHPQGALSQDGAPFTYGSPAKSSLPAHKLKLPCQVTPCRESGPSQVERRLEALTLELEKELELHMKKEYFGICIKCGKGVYGASQACQAMGNLYHTNCFTCCSCGRRLRGKAFYNVSGKVYCEEDFLYSGFQQTADKCFVCGHLIMEMILQALGKSYHPGCFRCIVCNEGLDGVPFTVDVENNIYCVKDYHTVFAPKCASCNQPILPAQGSEETIRVVSMDKDYHVECYHCEDCGLQLNDEEGHRCYPLEDHLLCHSCHLCRLKAPGPPPPSYPVHVTEL
uniref:WT1 interacting protein n=1 Tax=Scleropages formosus TaxID=113540 RepID=A0A8C9W230_SCLFO